MAICISKQRIMLRGRGDALYGNEGTGLRGTESLIWASDACMALIRTKYKKKI